MSNAPIEIERKLLIKYPDTKRLSEFSGARVMEMSQTYLLCDTGSLRVRKTVCGGTTVYHRNKKVRITDAKSEEYETEISEETYEELLLCADSSRRTVQKTRYAIPYGGFILEIDVYPFWSDRAVLEVELEREEDENKFTIPDCIEVIKDVTSDKRYSNRALAREIITEAL